MPEGQEKETYGTIGKSPRNWGVLLLLSIFFGELGVDHFYAGKIISGILKLVYFCIMFTLCFFLIGLAFIWIWWLVDIILILLGRFTDAEGRVISNIGGKNG